MNDASEHEENRYTVRQTKGGKTKREAKERILYYALTLMMEVPVSQGKRLRMGRFNK